MVLLMVVDLELVRIYRKKRFEGLIQLSLCLVI